MSIPGASRSSFRRRILAPLALVVGGLLVGVVLTEVVYRVARTWVCVGRVGGALFRRHPDIGWVHQPGTTAWIYECVGRRYEWQTVVSTNSHGLRDREYAYERSPGTARVLLLGDSMTEAVQVPFEASFAKLTESDLQRAGYHVEVLNAGVAGYSTDNELLFFRDEGVRYRSDIVVLVLHARNDLLETSAVLHARMYAPGAPPPKTYFTLENGDLVPHPSTQQPSVELDGWRAHAAQWVREHLYLVRVLDRLVSHPASASPEPRRSADPSLAVYAEPQSPELERSWAVTEQLMLRLQREVEASGARFVVAVMPSRDEVAALSLAPPSPGTPSAGGRFDYGRPERRLRSFLDGRQIRYLDLLPPLRAHHERTSSTGYYVVDIHLAGDGHRVVADALRDFLAPMLDELALSGQLDHGQEPTPGG